MSDRAPGTGTKKPLKKAVVTQVVPLQPMEIHSDADIHTAAWGGSHTGAGGYALKEAHAVPTLEQLLWQNLIRDP